MTDSLSQLLGLQDISQFQNSAAQGNVLLNLSPAVYGAKFDRSTWSPTESFATSFLQGVLGTALNQIGRQQVADQVSAVSKVLPALYRDPSSVEVPEGVDESAFSILRNSAATSKIARELQREQTAQSLIQELFKEKALTKMKADAEVENAGPIAKAKKEGELSAFDSVFGGKSSTSNPDDPRYKASQDQMKNLDDLRKEFNRETASFPQVLKAAKAISGALADTGKVSDQELVRYSIQMIEPGMAVREGEQAAIANSQSIPTAWKNQALSALNGESTLGEDVREGIKRLASRAYNSQKDVYDSAFTHYQGLAKSRNLLGENESISYLGEAPKSESIFGAPKRELDITSNITAALTQIRDALALPDITAEERNALVERARQIRGRINGGS